MASTTKSFIGWVDLVRQNAVMAIPPAAAQTRKIRTRGLVLAASPFAPNSVPIKTWPARMRTNIAGLAPSAKCGRLENPPLSSPQAWIKQVKARTPHATKRQRSRCLQATKTANGNRNTHCGPVKPQSNNKERSNSLPAMPFGGNATSRRNAHKVSGHCAWEILSSISVVFGSARYIPARRARNCRLPHAEDRDESRRLTGTTSIRVPIRLSTRGAKANGTSSASAAPRRMKT